MVKGRVGREEGGEVEGEGRDVVEVGWSGKEE